MKGGNNEELTPEVRLMQVEVKFNDCLEQINTLDTAFSEQIQKLQDRLMSLEGEIGGVLEKINLGYNNLKIELFSYLFGFVY